MSSKGEAGCGLEFHAVLPVEADDVKERKEGGGDDGLVGGGGCQFMTVRVGNVL